MGSIPRDPAFDSGFAFLREGYPFISGRCDRLGSDIFQTRLFLRSAICMRGESAARLFYSSGKFTRNGAMPPTVVRLLQDKGSVQTLDGEAHRHRKALFLSIAMDEAAVANLVSRFRAEWLRELPEWTRRKRIRLFDEANLLLTRAVYAWSGLPLAEADSRSVAGELSSMIENAGRIGPRNWAALLRRRRTERRVRAAIESIRAGALMLPDEAPASRFATFRAPQGALLAAETAAVELINCLRPVVAVGRFIVYCALALHRHPEWQARFAAGDEADLESFVEEVRRLSPFFPVIGGVTTEAFDWQGYRFPAGQWVLLDLFGTNRDPSRFAVPERFDPARAPSWRALGHDFVPQGAGDPHRTHRCPGEMITVALMKEAVRLLTQEMRYDVPAQDLSVSLRRMPALPASGFVMDRIGSPRPVSA